MLDPNEPRLSREDVPPEYGQRLIVQCDRPGCDHAVLMDPRPLFGAPRNWPAEGRSYRFRCTCGHREARVTYTRHSTALNGPIPTSVISLWY